MCMPHTHKRTGPENLEKIGGGAKISIENRPYVGRRKMPEIWSAKAIWSIKFQMTTFVDTLYHFKMVQRLEELNLSALKKPKFDQ